MRLVGSFNAPLNCIDDLGVEGSGMWVILIEEARDLVMLGSRIWTSEEPENLGLETGLALGLSLTILAWLGLLKKLVLGLGEAVIEKGFDVLVIIFVLGSDGEGEMVNLEFWDPSWKKKYDLFSQICVKIHTIRLRQFKTCRALTVDLVLRRNGPEIFSRF